MSKGPYNGRSRARWPHTLAAPGAQSRRTEREQFLANRELQRRALDMWGRKMDYKQIGAELECSAYTAWHLVRQGLEVMDVPEARHRRAQENRGLDEMERTTWAVVARPGYQVSNSGRIVMEPEPDRDGRPVPQVDQAKRLAAIGTLLRIQERRARLNGLDEPAKVDVAVSLEAALAAVELLEAEAVRRESEMRADVRHMVALPSAEHRS
jgi:hypothetical protein